MSRGIDSSTYLKILTCCKWIEIRIRKLDENRYLLSKMNNTRYKEEYITVTGVVNTSAVDDSSKQKLTWASRTCRQL